jgi:hypothetical protein
MVRDRVRALARTWSCMMFVLGAWGCVGVMSLEGGGRRRPCGDRPLRGTLWGLKWFESWVAGACLHVALQLLPTGMRRF